MRYIVTSLIFMALLGCAVDDEPVEVRLSRVNACNELGQKLKAQTKITTDEERLMCEISQDGWSFWIELGEVESGLRILDIKDRLARKPEIEACVKKKCDPKDQRVDETYSCRKACGL